MIDDTDAPFIEKPKRDPRKWKKGNGGDKWANKAKKQWKNRERELHDDDDEREIREYR